MNKEIIDEKEKLAELCHKQWSGWIKYMFGKCLKKIDGTILIPEWAVTRWRRQAYTPYQKLSHKEKESDRTEADRFLTLLKQQPTTETINTNLLEACKAAKEALRSYQYGNSSTELAEEIANQIEAAIPKQSR